MEKRKNLVKKFSSFISFTGDNYQNQVQLIWNVDFQLENNMKSNVEADPEAKEIFWAQYFLKILLFKEQSEANNLRQLNPECSFPTAKRHFSAYLQEACFKAAKDIHYEFKYIKHKYSLEEYFQIANIAASSPVKFFKTFNFERNSINIEAYAIAAFKRFIRNQIYQQDLEARRTRFSNYGLLRDFSPGELNEAFETQNFSSQQIVLYRIAWECFKEIFKPSSNSLNRRTKPSSREFMMIAGYYNLRCNQLNLPHVLASDTTIQEMLATCINIARNYRTKQYFSLEEDYYGFADDQYSTWDLLIQQEEWQQVQIIVDDLFTKMPVLCQIILKLCQGLSLTQTETANILKSQYPEVQKQYQVARNLKRYKRIILRNFAQKWNQINPEVYINDEQDIEKIKSALEQCLKLYCKQTFFSILDKTIQELSDEENQNILMNQQSNYDLDSNFNVIAAVKFKLVGIFKQRLEESMCLGTDSLSFVNHKLVDVVDEWIQLKKREI